MGLTLLTTLTSIIWCVSASTFLWPSWGGSPSNQQRPPDGTSVQLSTSNVAQLQEQCTYQSMGSQLMYGYIAAYIADDGSYSGVFTDFSGNVINLNLDDCSERWKVNITDAIGADSDYQFISRNGLSLFRLADGTEGVVLGTPNTNNAANVTIYAMALDLNTGALLWKVHMRTSAQPFYPTR